MRNFWTIFFIVLSSSGILWAQSSSDLKLRVQNSFIKLYENPDVAIRAAKEIRDEGDQTIIKDILTKAYLLKGDYLESVRSAFEKSDLRNSHQNLLRSLVISREFYHLNLYEQTSKIISPLVSGKSKSKNPEKDDVLFAQLFQLQAKNFIALQELDKAQKSLNQSSEFAKNIGITFDLILKENELLTARILSEKGQIKEAWKVADELLKSLDKFPRAVYLRSLTQQFRASLYFEDQKYEEAAACLQDALLPIEQIGYEPLKNSIYADLTKNYLVIKKNDEYGIYKKKLSESSKFLEAQKKEARRDLIQLSTELNSDNNKLIKQKKTTQLLYFVGISLMILAVFIYLYVREIQKDKTLARQIKFFESLNIPSEIIVEKIKEKDPSKKQLLIPKQTENEILEGLQQFEESKKYLDNKMSLAILSAHLETNTKYVSEIINKYKDKNFNTYINELRIKHVIQLLSEDRSYLQYKISYIAEIGGFTSHSAFTNIFKSVTGMSPQEYMQTLRKD
ncbi:helix-turn-helix domain-containing protein [Kaistella jeonii]|uniref:HTH araC/xylS-type domain-containing protein n=1 Tax=Kaistella jeonii TaxID=266749 RepID=A0A0C1CYC5_9FLAO|nr:helix-turn-helix domain-containing protein [Kaistella jeonii]KIA89391.1 hypothetical protein OA86_07325 [Kaistella jeonii]SFC04611.1 AraC-type DNA-binding protein [Kaistella jeonii]VEI96727.1 Melibiose operon regulatory protein [Kaistella jeonii]